MIQRSEQRLLLGLNLDDITQIAVDEGLRRFVGAQLADWLYKKRVTTFDQITNLSKTHREEFAAKYGIGRYAYSDSVLSVDGTRKYLFTTVENNAVEAVYIPSKTSRTLCISSQSGCRMGCRFCMTARIGFKQNLSATDIINQVLSVDESAELTNIVFMGMGEPLDNLPNVMKAIEILTASWGLAWSPTRITVSTIGVVGALRQLLDGTKVNIAVSLHNPFTHERLAIMPAENRYQLSDVIELLRQYDFSHQRRVSFEYIVFEGFNDTQRHIDKLVELLRPIRGCRVNLIRFHQIDNSELRGASDATIKHINTALNNAGVITTTRSSRGEDIWAACGMLAAKNGD